MWNLKKMNSEKQNRVVITMVQGVGEIGRWWSKGANF